MAAVGVFAHVVSRFRVGPRAASPAHAQELTHGAFTFIRAGVPDVLKKRRGLPDCLQRCGADVTAFQVQIPAGLDNAAVGNEQVGNSRQAPSVMGVPKKERR